jgi:hypothetical protein
LRLLQITDLEPVLGVDDGFPKATIVDTRSAKHQSAGSLLSRDLAFMTGFFAALLFAA